MTEAILVPLKRFDTAKARLRAHGGLDATTIARTLAQGVILACAPREVIVVSEDDAVSDFAAALGAGTWRSPATDLNGAIQDAYVGLGPRYERLIVAHGDLRNPTGLGDASFEGGVTLVADHHGTGTNVLSLPSGLDFVFHYGENSLARHVREADRLQVSWRVISDSPWRFDVDEIGDLTDR